MRAKVEQQPFATLVTLGIRTIITTDFDPFDPKRKHALQRGERIAIVAGPQRPELGWRYGDLRVESTVDGDYGLTNYSLSPDADIWHRLALGNVVCTVAVDDVLPIVGGWFDPTASGDGSRWIAAPGGELALVSGRNTVESFITDQLPLGDFTPGRWGLMLSDPQPCDPIPCKGRQGVFGLPAEIAEALR